MDIQTHEANRIPTYHNAKRLSPKHMIIKLSKINKKERILNIAREKKKTTYKGTPIRLSADFSAETLWPGESGKM